MPYRLAVEVTHGTERAPESLRSELEIELLGELRASGCYRAVDYVDGSTPDAPPSVADLRLALVLHSVEQTVEHELSIAQRNAAGSNPIETDRKVVASIRARVEARLTTTGDGAEVRNKAWLERTSHRPILSEDARYEAQIALIEALTREVRQFACGGSARKMRRLIEQASQTSGR